MATAPAPARAPNRHTSLLLAVGVAALLALVAWQRHAIEAAFLHRAFHDRRIADGECRMWQAYYAGNTEAMAAEMLPLLTSEFGLAREDALAVARDLGSAAFRFQQLAGNYDAVLPDLESAYSRIRQHTGVRWDPAEAARAELDWWVARRTPGRSDPEKVGAAIAHLYTVLSGKDNPAIRRAGLLRAQAAKLRDDGGDWTTIRRLLRESYSALVEGLAE